ncbi:inositol hexaphosphate kinase 2, isoform CRA_e [Rattus norvegicus]|uniref:Inositol hexaphosphate kinase 2, isoform CRA_e n=1 Tax=Rattus norvegicus TaxID=10116 RepID=A6I387_RAT|nr:inositol hexaphosphate kinase 2, isoform CRA_e [Rattus norvegicus]
MRQPCASPWFRGSISSTRPSQLRCADSLPSTKDKAKVPLLAGHPCPVFIPLVVPYAHREVWSPDTPPPAPLRPEVSSLSEHAFPCSKQAGRQQGLSRLSDRGAERTRRKGVQPVGCKALVGTAEVLPPDRLSSYTWQVLETQKGELLSRLPTMSVFLPLICWCSFCSFVTQTTKTNKCITEKDKRLFAHHVVASEAFARCLCCVDCLPLYFALLAQSFLTLSAFT